jgi:hypothetical protein
MHSYAHKTQQHFCLPFNSQTSSFQLSNLLHLTPSPVTTTSVHRLLSPRKVHAVGHNTGVVDSAGTKRRLDEDLNSCATSSTADQYFTNGIAGQQQQLQFCSTPAEFESMPKRVEREVGVQSLKGHKSAFDLVDDALHISSDDEFEFPAST